MKSNTMHYVALFLGVFSLSTSAIFVKMADAPSAIIAFYRLLFSLLMLLPFLLLNSEHKKSRLHLSKKQLILTLLSGLLLAIHYVLWFESLNYTSTASSTVIVSLQPLFAIAWSTLFLKERLRPSTILSCLVSISGCIVIGWGDFQVGFQALFGDLLAFLAAGIISLYFFIGQLTRKSTSAIHYSVLSYLSSTIFLALYGIIKQNSFVSYSFTTWKAFLGLALISTICGQFIFNVLLKWVPATTISVTILGEPIGTSILAFIFFNETVPFCKIIGMMIILIGIATFCLSSKNNDKKPASTIIAKN